jgi:hypothetical protein
MDLSARFAQVSSSNIGRINTLEESRRYPITYAQRQDTMYGPTVLLTVLTGDAHENIKVFLPKRHSLVFEDDNIENINNGTRPPGNS